MDASERRKQASEEAASWWLRLQSPEITRVEREEFVDWLRESAVHVAEMLQIAKLHGVLEQFQGWASLGGAGSAIDDDQKIVQLRSASTSRASSIDVGSSLPGATQSRRKAGRTQRLLRFGAMAAGLAALAVCAVLLSSFWTEQAIQTQRGERREVSLSDGSVVEVDPETRFVIDFEEHVRRVVLKQGRALFRVAKNPERPFLVYAGGTTVRAIGTAFGVERQERGVVVTVAEGKVGVFRATDSANPSTFLEHPIAGRATPSPDVILTADQQVTVSRSGVAAAVHHVDSERELAWARGQLVLDNETIAAAVAEFNRYNRLQLRLVNEEVGRRSVSGVFNASDPESFIQFLQTVTPVRVTRGESEIIVR